jgi:hypothetical protein
VQRVFVGFRQGVFDLPRSVSWERFQDGQRDGFIWSAAFSISKRC